MNLSRFLPDRWFICLQQLRRYGRLPDLHRPRTFHDKIQWYKLYVRDPLMTKAADKLAARDYVRDKGLAALLNELLGVYDSPDTIDLRDLPSRFVLKANHGSNMNIICRDKSTLDWSECRSRMRGWLATRHFEGAREWAYKHIQPRLLCEEYLDSGGELLDYKFYCFHGKPEMLLVCTGRHSESGLKYTAYNLNWQRLPVTKGRPAADFSIEKPATLTSMIEAAGRLSQDFLFVRVDFYEVAGRLVFGELTFYPDGGFHPFEPDSYNYAMGSLLKLPIRR